ncbi:uncharacterized protein LOC108742908 [Agrilus planipennis]|uniref:Uncharacterized protein LOC108742908 n=1 Tax=Agrilus planipennis TaxID=224129 RepID=A0A1W4XN07_AGRPL|nr:uncharacterized protein LOC108742908 [Agrilus planipennis]
MKFFYKSLLILLLYWHSSKSEPSGYTINSFRDVFSLIRERGISDGILCLKEKIIRMIEKIPKEFYLLNGIIVKENVKAYKNISRKFDEIELPTNKSDRAELVNKILFEKINEFVNNHLIEVKVPDETLEEFRASFDEGRKSKKKGMIPYLFLITAKVIAIGAFFIKFISLMAVKALVLAKMALVLTVGIVLKRFSSYSSTYASRPFEFHQPPFYNSNNWRRVMPDDVQYDMMPIQNVAYSIINDHDI